jgi:DNA repair exonuclease SbcCD ATPase subunit
MKDLLKEINDKEKEKKADAKEKLKSFQEILAKYDGIAGECNVKGLSEKGESSDDEDHVGNMETDCRTCSREASACQGSIGADSTKITSLKEEIDALEKEKNDLYNRSNPEIKADIKHSKDSIKTLESKTTRTNDEDQKLKEEKAKLVTLEKELKENSDTKLVRTKSDQIKEKTKLIDEKRKQIEELKAKPKTSSAGSEDNLKNLEALLDAASKLQEKEDVKANHKAAKDSLNGLRYLSGEEQCRKLTEACDRCTDSAKKVYTEAEKKDGDGGSSNKGN